MRLRVGSELHRRGINYFNRKYAKRYNKGKPLGTYDEPRESCKGQMQIRCSSERLCGSEQIGLLCSAGIIG